MNRIQRKRTKGWRMSEGAIYVGRPTIWGNPYKIGPDMTAQQAVNAYRALMIYRLNNRSRVMKTIWTTRLETLRGHDLACWCPLDQPCHADVLLELLEATK